MSSIVCCALMLSTLAQEYLYVRILLQASDFREKTSQLVCHCAYVAVLIPRSNWPCGVGAVYECAAPTIVPSPFLHSSQCNMVYP